MNHKTEAPSAARSRVEQLAESMPVRKPNGLDDFAGLTVPPAWKLPPALSQGEWEQARLTPRCIVDCYLYADVASNIAPGGTGKTTLLLYEAVHIALGLPLWGLQVVTPGPVLIISAEDRRQFLVARLREICKELRLTRRELEAVWQFVRIDDRTTDPRKLTLVVGDVVLAADFAGDIVTACAGGQFQPVLVHFDPMVSFGVGEKRVNDAEQGLVEAARIISGGLDCCVRYTHHTGKGQARDKASDQYAGRGGSSLPDGCRMVSVMQALDDTDLQRLCGARLAEGQSAFSIARPKLSYAPPQPGAIYVRRTGYAFEVLIPPARVDEDKERESQAMQLHAWLGTELREGRRYTTRTLESVHPCGLARDDGRAAVAWLTVRGLVEVADLPGERPQRGARTYLHALPKPRSEPRSEEAQSG